MSIVNKRTLEAMGIIINTKYNHWALGWNTKGTKHMDSTRATPNSKKQNPKIHVLVLIVLDFQSQILLCSDKKSCLNLGVEEDFWNHNFSGGSAEIIRRIKKRVIKRFGK